MNEFVKAELKR